jgi:hypothetical protein
MSMKFLSVGDTLSNIKMLGRDALHTPLRKYVVYSLLFHVVLIGGLSVGLLFPEKPAPDPKKGPPAKKETTPAVAPEDTSKTLNATDNTKATGKAEDYYKRPGSGVETAKPDEIPKNPLETKDSKKDGLE